MNEKHSQVAALLIDLECVLRNMDLWDSERPSEAALESKQPFCVDTLEFEQWLQFIFIERMSIIVEQQLPLPEQCGLAPMAEERFRGSPHKPTALIAHLEEIDRTLSR